MSAFYPFMGGGSPKADIVCVFFLLFFLYMVASLRLYINKFIVFLKLFQIVQ